MLCCFREKHSSRKVYINDEEGVKPSPKDEVKTIEQVGSESQYKARGVHFSQLRDLVHTLPDTMDKETVTTADVIYWVRTNPKLVAAQSSWLKMLEAEDARTEEGVPLWGEATVMISHTWRYKFKDLVSSVVDFASGQEEETGKPSYIWIDMFVLNQFSSKSTNPDWLKETFTKVIKDIGLTVSIITPFEDPVSFRRVWCLWEVYLSIEYSKLQLILPKDEKNRFNAALMSDPYAVTEMLTQIERIDASNAEAFDPADRDMIFNAITSSMGFDEINSVVYNYLFDWVNEQCMDKVKAIKSGNLDADEAMAAPTNYRGSGSTFFRAITLKSTGLVQLCLLHPDIADVVNGTPDSWPPFSNALTAGLCDIADLIIDHPAFNASYIPWQIDSFMIKGKPGHCFHPHMDKSVPYERVVQTLKKFFKRRADDGFTEPSYEKYVELSIAGKL